MTNKELRDMLSQYPDDLKVNLSLRDYDGNDYMDNVKSAYVNSGILYIDNMPYYLEKPAQEIHID